MDRSLAGTVLADAVGARPTASAAPDTTGPHPFTSSGRVVLGCGANIAHLAELRAAADEAGLQPAIFAAAMERHAGMSVADAVDSVARSFAVAHGLHRPWKTLPDVPLPDAAGVSLNVVLDEGTVEGLRGPRRDASHVVVLDGIFDEKDRREIMGRPLPSRWALACSDYKGGAETWGLTEEAVTELLESPPEAVIRIQSRISALYPEYTICLMPMRALADPEDIDEGAAVLSPFVANAVSHGEHYDWHLDMDPQQLPPASPWATYHGLYPNREPDRPLFVSMLIYPQGSWPQDFDAETLFLDPETGTGVFSRPAPYRVVLMDQDVPHRISGPSKLAGCPRYSLVWKLVFCPKVRGASPSISRPEWGPPTRFGSAAPPAPMFRA